MVHLILDPPQAPRDLILSYFKEGNEPSSMRDSFVMGEQVVVDRPVLPGIRGIEVNGQVCDGRFEIVSNIETDIELKVDAAACSIRILGMHSTEDSGHTNSTATILLSLPRNSSVTVRSLNPDLVVPPRLVEADESGFATVTGLVAGRYELALLIEGKIVNTVNVTVGPGDERSIDLTVSTAAPTYAST